MRGLVVGVAIATLAVSAANAATAPSMQDAFNAATTAGLAAEKAGDLKAAAQRFAEANRIIPNYPPVLAERAKVAAMAGDVAGALALIRIYAGTGLSGERIDKPVFDKVRADPGFAPLRERFLANAQPIGHVSTLATLVGGAFLAESVAWDQARHRYLISSIHTRTIVQWDHGVERPYLRSFTAPLPIFNLAIDPKRDRLWATASAVPQADHYAASEAGHAALLEIRLSTGKLLHRYEAPKAEARGFGDLLLAPDGTVYVSDGLTGEIWRHCPGAAALDLLVPAGVLASPQGLVPTPDGKRLIVADYVLGLMSVDRHTGAAARVPTPADAELIWIDGMSWRGRTLIAVQNGTTRPNRILALTLDKTWRRVTGWRILAANLPELDEPTGGTVVGRDFVFVARSQWNSFADDGGPKVPQPPAPVIARLRLPG